MATVEMRARVVAEALARPKRTVWKQIRRGWQLYLLLALPLAWLVVFCYYPMYGAQIAFREFLPGDRFWDSKWVGLAQFRRFYMSHMFWVLIRNTLTLSFYHLAAGFPFPILLALCLNQVRQPFFKQFVQMVSYAPHFISTVVMVGIILQFLDLRRGPINILIQSIGLPPFYFMAEPNLFPSIYVWTGIWQSTGFGSIIYLAALSTVDPALHEAAVMDGASRLRRIWHIDLPSIMPIAVVMLILTMGQLLNVGFDKAFLLQNPLNLATSEIISTYVYKVGLTTGMTNFSYAAAIGLFNSVVGLLMIIAARHVAKKLTGSSLW